MLYDCLACSASEWRFAKNRSPLQDRDSQPRGRRSTRAAKRTPETLWLKCQTGLTSEDLAQKTRRGLEGRIRQGKSGGGLCFGYAVVRKLDAAGEVVRGERRINEAEAATVRRTFEEFAIGRSPRAIAQSLNKDGIPGPAAKSWGPSTIYGNWQRGTGNPQQRALCRPTGLEPAVRQRSKYRAASGETQPGTKWIIELVPHLGIIDDPLWSRVKERQRDSTLSRHDQGHRDRSERARRPSYLLSGLLKCGTCGGGFSKISRLHHGCSTARNKGTCDNLLTVRRGELETKVLDCFVPTTEVNV